MPAFMRNIHIDEVSHVDRGAGEGVRVLLIKRDETTPENKPMELKDILSKLSTEEQTVIKAAIEAKNQPVAKNEPAMSEEVKKLFDAEKVEKAALQKRIADIEDERETEQFTKIATDKFSHISGMPATEMAQVLKSMKKTMPKEQYEKALKSWESANVAIKQSSLLTKALGSSVSGEANTPAEKLEGICKSYMDKEPKLTHEDAYQRAVELNPDLYDEHRRNRKPMSERQ
jgi:hypothetical protein